MPRKIGLRNKRLELAPEEFQDNRQWTVLEALEDMAETFRKLPEDRRPTEVIIVAKRTHGDASYTWDRFAGTTVSSAVSILERLKFELLLRNQTS